MFLSETGDCRLENWIALDNAPHKEPIVRR